MSSPFPAVLSFAASDPTGGAGAQADLLTLASLGCHPLSVITAISAQDTRGVEGMLAIEPEWILRQARLVLADIQVAAFKIGVLGSARNAEAVAAILAEHPRTPVVLDPVLASGRGDPLSDEATVQVLRSALLPRTTILTPNSIEARRLALGAPDADLEGCARELTKLGCKYVLITGTHEGDAQVENVLYGAGGKLRDDKWPRLPGEYHGSGCTLASAIAAQLAKGMDYRRCGAISPGAYLEIPGSRLAAGQRSTATQSILQMKLSGLYAITPDIADRDRLKDLVRQALDGGVTALQYRCKSLPSSHRLDEATALAALCRTKGVTLIVNDDPGIAIASGADGVHLGRDDDDPAATRSKLAGKLLGISCYDSLAAARAAVAAGADYVAFGSVFPSPTKPAAVRAPHSLFGEARALGVPTVAIGGITLENAPQLLEAGADCLAVISDLFDAPDVAARARAYGKLFGT